MEIHSPKEFITQMHEMIKFMQKIHNQEYKIAAIGIKVKKWIAYHGFSLNINVNKSDYRGIVPCGILNKGIINVADLGKTPNDEVINKSIKENFYKLFNS